MIQAYFDTLRTYNKLIDSGLPEAQSKIIIETMNEAMNNAMGEVAANRSATKQDVIMLTNRLTIRTGALIIVAIAVSMFLYLPVS